jgi:Na+/melibiose symporter-like transporter
MAGSAKQVESVPASGSGDAALAEDAGAGPRLYRAGTLTYTKVGLITLCVWLLWGDFCFTLFEDVLPKILPLQLKGLGGKNWIIGLACTTIPSVMKLIVGPIVSFRSDRFRSRWGRRRPFLMAGTPLVALTLFALGFVDETSRLVTSLVGGLSPTTVAIGVVLLFVLGYNFFNSFIETTYKYLFNDVVPRECLARVMAAFRFVALLAGSLFGGFVLPLAKTHMREIYAGSAILLLVMFGMMVLKVKEGDYPPPRPLAHDGTRRRDAIATYFSECFTGRLYWYYFLASALWALGFSITGLDIFWAQSLGVDLKNYGFYMMLTRWLTAVLILPSGAIADRIHPVRVMLLAKLILVAVMPLSLVFLFYGEAPRWSYAAWVALQFVAVPMAALYKAAELPMAMRILPQDRYGQFFSAAEAVKAVALIIGGPVSGWFIDAMARMGNAPLWEYRAVPLWAVSCYAISLIFLWLLYRDLQHRPGAVAEVPYATKV